MSEERTPFVHPADTRKAEGDGGPAFPVWELNGNGQPEMTGFGMSLRDWFAGMAMQGMLSDAYWSMRQPASAVAKNAYAMADAMLAERAKDRGND